MSDAAPIASRAAFQDAVRAAVREAADADCRELWWCDADFAAWPLGERAVVDDLTRWIARRKDVRCRFHLIAANFDAVERRHPRWVDWRRRWAHAVECRSNFDVEAGRFPTLLLAPGALGLSLVDRVAFRGGTFRDAATGVLQRERLEAVLQQSVEAFPARVTGL